ncbi:MAG: hypothetical protein LUM44_09470 [Pyrinomonadaceae bacterium]|nr:hypothetical protein [Pyrinomonadaceae bacterium]
MSASKEFNEKVVALHYDLLAGHPVASAQIAELLLPKIILALTRKFSNVADEHLIQIATHNAILYYLKSPNKFDANRGSLINFIWLRARSSLLNILSSKENPLKRKEFVELEEVHSVYGNEESQNESIEAFLIDNEQDNLFYKRLSVLLPDQIDRNILELMMNGERNTVLFAAILGIADKSLEEQCSCVKKHKDRIKKFIQRHRAEIIE